MNKVELIQGAIRQADLFTSKLTPEALAVPGFTSLKIRHLLNNLGAISTNYLDCGSHKGGSLCSTVFSNYNLIYATAIDSFVEFTDGDPMQELINNAGKFMPKSTLFKLLMADCWSIPMAAIPGEIDMYLFDGAHDYESQRKAISHFLPALANEFILLVDDYLAFEGVKQGTQDGLVDSGCKVLFEQELYDGVPGNNMQWHNGLWVALMQKP